MATQVKTFAPDYPRNEQDWILFPRDVEWRKRLFPQGVFEHPAKANMFLIQELVRYVSEPGETILDPFGGTGTLLIGALEDRHIILIELEQHFLKLISEAANRVDGGNVIVLPGDCRQVLPVPCDHVVTSPPYGQTLKGTLEKHEGDLANYAKSPLNIGHLNAFIYAMHMAKVYDKLYESIRSGGTLSVIIKDQANGPNRIFHSEGCIKGASRAGFVLRDWFKLKPPGSYRAEVQKKKGASVIEDEDILIFHKP